jgi:uncharacterized protein DUF6629
MCFSATASFTAAATLGGIGIVALAIARHKPRLLPLAATPVLFALQQTTEGFLWLALTQPSHYVLTFLPLGHLASKSSVAELLAFLFLLFAYVVWPIWIPSVLHYAEVNRCKRIALRWVTAIGMGVSAYLLFHLLFYRVKVAPVEHHISYVVKNIIDEHGAIPLWEIFVYGVATILPFFISSLRYSALFGIVLLVSCITSYTLWYYTFSSVWCFFAACLSTVILFLVKKN